MSDVVESKSWYTSKTLWANFVAAIAFFVQQQYGFILPLEVQAQALVIVNIILRCISNTGIA